jgi:hypothetical protein
MTKKSKQGSGSGSSKDGKNTTDKGVRKKGRNPIAGTRHGEGRHWQFRFEKTTRNEVLEELFWCRSREDFERRSGFKLEEDLPWSAARTTLVENVLLTLARRIERGRHDFKGAGDDSISIGSIEHGGGTGTIGLHPHEPEPEKGC